MENHHHEHEHDHHEHDHEHFGAGESDAKSGALLNYMLEHNVHHNEELKSLAESLPGEVSQAVLKATDAFDEANKYLSEAVEIFKKNQ